MHHRVRPWVGALLLVVLGSTPAAAQLEENLSAYPPETVDGYLKPLQQSVGVALNANWFTTSSIPSNRLSLNFDLKAVSVFYGDSDRTFTARTGGDFDPPQEAEAPTVVGSTEAVRVPGNGGTEFVFPGGFDLSSLSLAVPQLTLGNIYGTQAAVRWIAFDTGDEDLGDISLFGVGVRHQVSRYFDPGFPIDLAASFYFQSFDLGGDDLFAADTWSLGVEGSYLLLPFLQPYAAFSYLNTSTTVHYTDESGSSPEAVTVDMETASTVRLEAGAALFLGPVHLNLAGNFSDQIGVTAGLGAGF